MQITETLERDINLKDEMKAAKRILKSIGLVETTSKVQKKDGTLQFSDPKSKNGLKYTLHLNGYYRKYIPVGEWGFFKNNWDKNRKIPMTCYQLNRTKKVPYKRFWRNPNTGETFTFNGIETQRILIPGQYKLMAERIKKIHLK